MNDNVVIDYGWNSADAPGSCAFLAPLVIKLLAHLKVKRVLDIGSGNGTLCSILEKHGFDAVGVETDQGGVECARAACPNIKFYCFGVQDEPSELMSKEKPFDAVVSTEVVEHLFSPHMLPIYAKQTLRDNGFLIISTPYHGYFKNLALSIFNKWDFHHTPLWHGGHIKFWSRATLTRLLGDNGFRVIQFHGVGRIPYLWRSMVLVAQRIPHS
jgi:2-polyprenyl-3-methyl-5-hydroxy-6-metoxy-1,4-benzoquinol methylase